MAHIAVWEMRRWGPAWLLVIQGPSVSYHCRSGIAGRDAWDSWVDPLIFAGFSLDVKKDRKHVFFGFGWWLNWGKLYIYRIATAAQGSWFRVSRQVKIQIFQCGDGWWIQKWFVCVFFSGRWTILNGRIAEFASLFPSHHNIILSLIFENGSPGWCILNVWPHP